MKNILVIGSGFAGSVISRELAEAGLNIKIIDKRNHIGGNAYDYLDENGILIHKYGPHIFHTNNKRVFDYLSKYTEWIEYKHKVKAKLRDGSYVTFPVNKETKKIVGENNILDIFFRPYTRKMWGMELEDLNPDIAKRIPIRDDDNEYYFPDDKYQYMPKNGYTNLFNNLLNHENISIELNKEFDKEMLHSYSHIFNSMPIDEFYNFKFGELPYRSIKFHNLTVPLKKALPSTTVNFTNDSRLTRVTEWKNISNNPNNPSNTTLTFEEPCDYKNNHNERYYPVKDLKGDNKITYQKYKKYNNEKDPNITFIGRCGLYVYLDMHQAISSSLAISKKFLRNINLD